jgi:hypothetical protein
MENSVVVSDYQVARVFLPNCGMQQQNFDFGLSQQMDRILKEERKYIVDICQVCAAAPSHRVSAFLVFFARGPDNGVSQTLWRPSFTCAAISSYFLASLHFRVGRVSHEVFLQSASFIVMPQSWLQSHLSPITGHQEIRRQRHSSPGNSPSLSHCIPQPQKLHSELTSFSQKSILRDAVSDLALHYLAKLKILLVKDIERDEIEFTCKTLQVISRTQALNSNKSCKYLHKKCICRHDVRSVLPDRLG